MPQGSSVTGTNAAASARRAQHRLCFSLRPGSRSAAASLPSYPPERAPPAPLFLKTTSCEKRSFPRASGWCRSGRCGTKAGKRGREGQGDSAWILQGQRRLQHHGRPASSWASCGTRLGLQESGEGGKLYLRPVLEAQTLTPSALLCATWSSISRTPRDSLSPRWDSRCGHPMALQTAGAGSSTGGTAGDSVSGREMQISRSPWKSSCQPPTSAALPALSLLSQHLPEAQRGCRGTEGWRGSRSHFTWAFSALACTASFRFRKTSSLSASLDRSSGREILTCLEVAVPALLLQLLFKFNPPGCSMRERAAVSLGRHRAPRMGSGQEPRTSQERLSSSPSRSQQTRPLPVPALCARLPSCAELGAAQQPHSQPCRAACCLPAHGHLPATHAAGVVRSTGIQYLGSQRGPGKV